MTTAEIQRRFLKLKRKREMLAKYDKIWFGGGSFQEFYKKAGERFPDTPDWCPLCKTELTTCFHEHLEKFHSTSMKKIIGGDTDMENNELLEDGILSDMDKEARD